MTHQATFKFCFAGMRRFIAVAAIASTALTFSVARADTTYDWLAGTQWYVPAANVLAYSVVGNNFSNPLPTGDQTLWDITSSSNGSFSGTTAATLNILGSSTSSSNATMDGIATPGGQIRIIFTTVGGSNDGSQTVGIGQFRNQGGEDFMQMQMMTGADGFYVTHWAYMAQVPDGSFVPPAPDPEVTLLSPEWSWMNGTTWNLAAPELLGGPAVFSVEAYNNGYFWGAGVGPDGPFSHIGSATPEGNVLFNFIVNGTLTNLTGMISGDGSNGTMALREYQGTDIFGFAAVASVVPEPGTVALLIAGALAGLTILRRRRN